MEFNRETLFSSLSNYKELPLLSKLSPSSIKNSSRGEIEGFKKAQRIAYDCATTAAKKIEVGTTELEIAHFMDGYLKSRGVTGGFHRPLAWFGERTRFKGMRKEADAFPTNKKIEDLSEPIILDVAPIHDGYVADIGFAFSLAPNPELVEARKFLLELRDLIPELFSSDKNVSEIWAEIDELIKDRGYQNCHSRYIMSVLGHRVYRIPFEWHGNYLGMYSMRAYWALASRGFFPEILSPYHKGEKTGLWAVEPHLGLREKKFGAKFEEILVVPKSGKAHWLTDDVPHIKLPEGLY